MNTKISEAAKNAADQWFLDSRNWTGVDTNEYQRNHLAKIVQQAIDADRAARQPQEWFHEFDATTTGYRRIFYKGNDGLPHHIGNAASQDYAERICRAHNSTLVKPHAKDTERLDWLDETQALCDDGDGNPYYQEWKVTASENYHGIREAIDSAILSEMTTGVTSEVTSGLAAEQEKKK